MEWSILHTLNDFLLHHDVVEDPLVFYLKISELLFAATLAVIFVAARGLRGREWRRAAVAAFFSAGIALAIGGVIARLVDRQRPFVDHPGDLHLFVSHGVDPGFPSDHATAAFAIAMAIVLRKRGWGIFALLAAAVLSVGRVAVGVHYPTDVVGGAVLGCAVALLLWLPALRMRLDALSDYVGARVDRATSWGVGKIPRLSAR
jgi:undecaprenyl-diphosphatase